MDITAANAVLTLQILGLFNVPQQLQGFAADDIYDMDAIESVETSMGVDGVLSAGFTYKPQVQRISLQADSPSNALFDVWHSSMVATNAVFPASGIISLTSLRRKFIQANGFLTQYKLPGAKRLMQPRQYQITWNSVVPVPTL